MCKVVGMTTHHRFMDVVEFAAETAAFFAAIAWTISLMWVTL
jgi:hypothetical protein